VLYLGEINSSQAESWRRAIEVFDEDAGQSRSLALFPEDHSAILIPAERRGGLGWEGFSRRIEGEGSFGIGQAVEQVGPRGEDETGGETRI